VIYLDPKCDDQIQNGDETDIDCGGGTCGPCGLLRECDDGPDCKTGNCADGTCAPLPCDNGVRDGAETDVDCGGTCRKCAGGRMCGGDADCFSGSCAGVCSSLSTLAFGDVETYPAGEKSYALFSADLDGDGALDLLAANEQANSVTVFLNADDGSGTFGRLAPDFDTGVYPTGGAIADFDGNGIPDLVTADYRGDSVSVLLGNGDGSLQAPRTLDTVEGGETSNLAVGDLDGDGVPDVVASNPGADSVTSFKGRADGSLEAGVTLPIGLRGGSAPFSVAIADFDGDGKNDLAVADMQSRSLIVKRGNGDGTLGEEASFPEGGEPAYILIASDVDLDGEIDLVVANRGSDDVSVLLGFGDGTFADPIVSSTGPGTGPYSLAIADFNQDGVPDVVTANFMSNDASVLIGVGNGAFDPPLSAGSMGNFPYGVVAGDWDDDGRPDIATCNALSNDVTVRKNRSL